MKKIESRKIFWITLFVIFCLVAGICLGFFIYSFVNQKIVNDAMEDAQGKVTLKVYVDNGVPVGTDTDVEKEDVIIREFKSIDFDELKKTAPDTYAWIDIPNTKISYPIVQHPTNDKYYVRRSINGAYDASGCIFSESLTDKDFEDENTLLYGHYMDNGTKFGELLEYSDKDFFNSHRIVYVYTETKILTYRIFAAVPFNSRHIIKTYDHFTEPLDVFLRDVKAVTDARAVFANGENFSADQDEKILTLSTCMENNSKKRFLVLARLIDSQLYPY